MVTVLQGSYEAFRSALPRGGSLPADRWATRHRTMVVVLWLHVAGILPFGASSGARP